MLTEVKAYSSLRSAPTLLLSDAGRAETDLLQIRDISGLDPVKASVNTSPFGSVDGVAYTGSNVPGRNIVLTIHPNPDWNEWTFESLRRLLYSYFMPKQPTRLVFYSDDMVPVEISGIVESITANQFSKDPEYLVSIICPNPYFVAVEPQTITGDVIRSDGELTDIDYSGSIETGIYVKVISVSGDDPPAILIRVENAGITYFNTASVVPVFGDPDEILNSLMYFEMNSIPMEKFVQNVHIGSGIIDNLLSKVQDGSSWPILQPGENEFAVVTDVGVQEWELVYFERFGGL